MLQIKHPAKHLFVARSLVKNSTLVHFIGPRFVKTIRGVITFKIPVPNTLHNWYERTVDRNVSRCRLGATHNTHNSKSSSQLGSYVLHTQHFSCCCSFLVVVALIRCKYVADLRGKWRMMRFGMVGMVRTPQTSRIMCDVGWY